MLSTNLAESNIIFGYSNKNMKEWSSLKKYMDGNLLNLLSVAKFIEQSLRFDLYILIELGQPKTRSSKIWIVSL
jgi:hypothetical protein